MSKLHTIWAKMKVRKGFEHIPYYISIDGDVINTEYKDASGRTRKSKIHTTNKDRKGYHRIKTKATISPSLSRNIGIHFIPNINNKPEVNHIDGNKDNNVIENLNWMTTRENIQHAIDNNLREPMLRSTLVAGCKMVRELYRTDNSKHELREIV